MANKYFYNVILSLICENTTLLHEFSLLLNLPYIYGQIMSSIDSFLYSISFLFAFFYNIII